MLLAVVGVAIATGAFVALPSSNRSRASVDCEKTAPDETAPLLAKAILDAQPRPVRVLLATATLLGASQACGSMLLMLLATSSTSTFGFALSSIGRAETYTGLALISIACQLGIFDRVVSLLGARRACAALACAYPVMTFVAALAVSGIVRPSVLLLALLIVLATAGMSICVCDRIRRR